MPAGCRFSWMEENFASLKNMSSNGRRVSHVQLALPTTSVAVSSVKDLFAFICSGPLVDKLGLNAEKIAESIDKWLMCASQLCRIFQLNELKLDDAQKVRLYHYYIPVFLWCEDQISQHASMFKDGEELPPLVVRFLNSSFPPFIFMLSEIVKAFLILIFLPYYFSVN